MSVALKRKSESEDFNKCIQYIILDYFCQVLYRRALIVNNASMYLVDARGYTIDGILCVMLAWLCL